MPRLKKKTYDQRTKQKIETNNRKQNAKDNSSTLNNEKDNNCENIVESNDHENLPKIIPLTESQGLMPENTEKCGSHNQTMFVENV